MKKILSVESNWVFEGGGTDQVSLHLSLDGAMAAAEAVMEKMERFKGTFVEVPTQPGGTVIAQWKTDPSDYEVAIIAREVGE